MAGKADDKEKLREDINKFFTSQKKASPNKGEEKPPMAPLAREDKPKEDENPPGELPEVSDEVIPAKPPKAAENKIKSSPGSAPRRAGGEGNFLLRLKSDYSEEFTGGLPGKCRVLGKNQEDVMVIVRMDYEKLLAWAKANPEKGQVVKPDGVRLEIKEYFDAASWAYR